MYKAVIFDLDGTLLNTLDDICNSMNFALGAFGLPGHTRDGYKYFVGNGVKVLVEKAVGPDHRDLYDKVAALYEEGYQKNRTNTTYPYHGIPEMLTGLAKKGIPAAVLSNKPHIQTLYVIHQYFQNIVFSVIQGQTDGLPLKPDPAPALLIASKLKIDPSDILLAGDTQIDILCAQNAGMTSVGVTWGFRSADELSQSGAKHIIHSPNELLALFI